MRKKIIMRTIHFTPLKGYSGFAFYLSDLRKRRKLWREGLDRLIVKIFKSGTSIKYVKKNGKEKRKNI